MDKHNRKLREISSKYIFKYLNLHFIYFFFNRYGISYHGAAQSASGTKDQVAKIREKNRELFHSISQYKNGIGKSPPGTSSYVSTDDMRYKTSQKSTVSFPSLTGDSKPEDDIEYEEEDDEYDDDDYYTMDKTGLETKSNSETESKKPAAVEAKSEKVTFEKSTETKKSEASPAIFTQSSPNQKQVAAVADTTSNYKVVQTQNGKTQIHDKDSDSSTTESVPEGFNGRVEDPDKPSSRISFESTKYPTRFLPSKYADANKIDTDDSDDKKQSATPDSYVTVTKSVTGSLDDTPPSSSGGKNFSQTFYTKSSTCGYFTFSCNVVYGANGKSKICKPKPPTNGKC